MIKLFKKHGNIIVASVSCVFLIAFLLNMFVALYDPKSPIGHASAEFGQSLKTQRKVK